MYLPFFRCKKKLNFFVVHKISEWKILKINAQNYNILFAKNIHIYMHTLNVLSVRYRVLN